MPDNNWGEADNQVGPEGGQMWSGGGGGYKKEEAMQI